jgi:putative transposase
MMMGEEGTLMKRRRHTPEQIIRKLREAERMLGEGKTVPEAAKELQVSEQTYHRWRNQYGGMKAQDAKRLKELARENVQLKAIVADQALEVRALKEIARGNW